MKKIIFFIATIILYSLNIPTVTARTQGNIVWLDNCNMAIRALKSFGFDFNEFTTSSNNMLYLGQGKTLCGTPPGSEWPSSQSILIMNNPIRIFVTNPGDLSGQGTCVFLANRQMIKTKQLQC